MSAEGTIDTFHPCPPERTPKSLRFWPRAQSSACSVRYEPRGIVCDQEEGAARRLTDVTRALTILTGAKMNAREAAQHETAEVAAQREEAEAAAQRREAAAAPGLRRRG